MICFVLLCYDMLCFCCFCCVSCHVCRKKLALSAKARSVDRRTRGCGGCAEILPDCFLRFFGNAVTCRPYRRRLCYLLLFTVLFITSGGHISNFATKYVPGLNVTLFLLSKLSHEFQVSCPPKGAGSDSIVARVGQIR